MLKKISLALDWTPNPMHSGIFCAIKMGYYKEFGLEIEWESPEINHYNTMPSHKVLEGKCMLGINPSENVIEAHNHLGNKSLVAIAAILQENASLLAINPQNIHPKEKLKYGNLDIPFEQEIVKKTLKSKYPQYNFKNYTTNKLDIYEQMYYSEINFAWIFDPIEGIEAKNKGLILEKIKLEDAGIPYGYAPVIITHYDTLQEQAQELKNFITATINGYHLASKNPEFAIKAITENYSSALKDEVIMLEIQKALSPYFMNKNNCWGVMLKSRWQDYLSWLLLEGGLNNSEIKADELFTNSFFDF